MKFWTGKTIYVLIVYRNKLKRHEKLNQRDEKHNFITNTCIEMA
jgi:hypothetical protein